MLYVGDGGCRGAGVARVRLICAEDIEGGSDRRALEPDASEVW
jgi:hypothetical protein